ncbi:pilus assembly PilX family protein [Wenzhouxiangella marina]|uniref:Type 4 fimbrial biogenesis protein PilX N-terminal domain-containing protein n=1 Tax=Wenzhouxiangella marina TaxID=1579979 RepID=A0A0K0XSE6_9GAMM|nr:PilX N-terminal domain-containing pilus assembly protein [Wenzhouxiangella marina]AKS40634.1 hypothetical protein WM2015_245 [Wenzhouxiangella marina]MBB6088402.1 type IV pilus assembly protein PilX [Wenzhouxiangella marina]
MSRSIRLPLRQRGAALLVALMVLLVLTLVGLTSSNVSIMQERMASNVSEMNLAFQQAEATIREIEQAVTQLATGSGDLEVIPVWPEMGLKRFDCSMSVPDPALWNWNGDPPPPWREAPESGNDYMIVDLSDYEHNGLVYGSPCRPIGEQIPSGEYFLIVARGESPTGTAEAIAQTIFFWPQ